MYDAWDAFLNDVFFREFPKPDSKLEVEISVSNITMDGLIYIEFNQELIVPQFEEFSPKLAKMEEYNLDIFDKEGKGHSSEENWALSNVTGKLNISHNKRSLTKMIAHERLNSTRDVLEFEYLLNSGVADEEIQYEL